VEGPTLNLEQLGTSGIIVSILLWLLVSAKSEIRDLRQSHAIELAAKDLVASKWQDLAFQAMKDSQRENFENSQMFDKALAVFQELRREISTGLRAV